MHEASPGKPGGEHRWRGLLAGDELPSWVRGVSQGQMARARARRGWGGVAISMREKRENLKSLLGFLQDANLAI